MKTKDIKMKIKEYFFLHPTNKLRVRQIEREVKVPLPSVIRYTKELVKEGILKKENIANVIIFSSNRSSKQYLLEKKLFNLRKLFDSGLINHLIDEYHNPPIIIFGSYSKGEDLEDSDIDLYIETSSSKKINLSLFENKLKRDVQPFIHKNIKRVKNKELINNIINGITLNGFIEVF
jgi:predicted nucleotidyltransferase